MNSTMAKKTKRLKRNPAARADAARLLAEGQLTDRAVAAQVGVNRMTLQRWKKQPDFAAEVNERIDELQRDVFRRGIASRIRRINALNDRWERMHRIVEERASAPEMQDVPGGKSGLLVRRLKSLGAGENAQTVEEYEIDVGLLREMREHERQAAQELGQLVNKLAMTTPDGEEEYKGQEIISDEEKKRLLLAVFARLKIPGVADEVGQASAAELWIQKATS